MQALTALRKEVEQDSRDLRTVAGSAANYTGTQVPSAVPYLSSEAELRRQSSLRLLQRQIERAKQGVAEAQETLRLQQARYGAARSSPSRISMSERLNRHRTGTSLHGMAVNL